MLDQKLERTVEHYCSTLVNCHKKQRRFVLHDGKRKPIWDLPMVAVTCSSKSTNKSNHSKPVNTRSYDKVPDLKHALLRCGEIGAQGNFDIYQVGRCAEPHAAKDCLLDDRKSSIDDLSFSTARVIKTREIKRYCGNCRHTFPQLDKSKA